MHRKPVTSPKDTGIQLVRLLGVEFRVALLVAEDVVVDTVGTQFLWNGNAEALANVRLHNPRPGVPVYTCRPSETVEVAAHLCRPLLVDRVAACNGCLVPVFVTADVGVGMVIANAGIHD